MESFKIVVNVCPSTRLITSIASAMACPEARRSDRIWLSMTRFSASDDNDAFHYGIGGGYRFNEHWEILLAYSEYNQEDLGATLSGDSGSYNLGETSVTSLGVSYRW